MEDVGTFMSPKKTSSRASNDDTIEEEDETEEHVETSHCIISPDYDV